MIPICTLFNYTILHQKSQEKLSHTTYYFGYL